MLFTRPFAGTAPILARAATRNARVGRRHVHFHNADQATFTKIIEENSKDKIVLVDFFADWCGPCKTLSPILEKLTEDSAGVKSGSGRTLDLVTVDTDVETALAQKYGIRSLPTVIAFKDGKPEVQFVGALPEPAVRRFLSQV